MTKPRKCGHALGDTRWCPDCELNEARASGEFGTHGPDMSIVEAVAKAIMFEDSGSTEQWQENTNLAEAAIRVCDARNPPRCSFCHASTSQPVYPAKTAEERKPLTDEQVLDEASHFGFLGDREQLVKFVRAIEREHGIGDQP